MTRHETAAPAFLYGLLGVGFLGSFMIIYWWIDAVGILAGIGVATIIAIQFMQTVVGRSPVAYTHGYHAGYHAGADIECFGPDCELLSMTHERMTQIDDVAASAAAEFDPFPAAR